MFMWPNEGCSSPPERPQAEVLVDGNRTTLHSSLMPETLEHAQWRTVGAVIDQNQLDFLSRRGSLVEDLVAWFKAIEVFRVTRDERMVFRDPNEEDFRQHKTWVASLIAEGERLVNEARERGLPEGAVKFQIDDVEATVEMLYLWQREWHGEKLSPQRRDEILKATFDVEKPAA